VLDALAVTRAAFVAVLTLSLLATPLAAGAQAIPRIGLLGDLSWEPLKQGLRDLGYEEGKNILFEDRRSDGRNDRWPKLAAELVALKVHAIVINGTPAALAAKRATTAIPIIMAVTGDPLSTGLVSSLAQPGGNVTGLMQLGPGLAAKRVELLKGVVPSLSRLAFLWNPGNPDQKFSVKEVQAGARALGVGVQSVEVGSRERFEAAFTAMMQGRPGALLMTGDPVHQLDVDWIIAFASKNRLPVMYQLKENVERGGLMSYGAVRADLVRRAATYVDKILKGAKAGDLPVEQPTTFELVINLKTAKALGLTMPPSLLLRADQVIE
jgi:putative ABC transport system substrate-binding protein